MTEALALLFGRGGLALGVEQGRQVLAGFRAPRGELLHQHGLVGLRGVIESGGLGGQRLRDAAFQKFGLVGGGLSDR